MSDVRWVNQIREWRDAAGLSVADAAARLGVTEYLYMRWETGAAEPTVTPFLLMPKVFGVNKSEVQRLEPVEAA